MVWYIIAKKPRSLDELGEWGYERFIEDGDIDETTYKDYYYFMDETEASEEWLKFNRFTEQTITVAFDVGDKLFTEEVKAWVKDDTAYVRFEDLNI